MNIKKSYNLWSEQYDVNKNKTRDLEAIVTRKTLVNFDFDNVLELGCGTGKNTQWLLIKAKNIIGLDFSEGMLAKAKAKIKTDKVTFIETDLTNDWNLENNYFDLITCSLTLEHIENLNVVFKQAHYKLKKGGLFFVSELHPFKQYLGSKARFETENGICELEVFTHHISDYLESASNFGFELVVLNEWFDDETTIEVPRLVSFVFRKKE
jgi:ubiquinone/menaquinone biosynthesis C-methylase UbiE